MKKSELRPIRAGDKVVRSSATKVKLGDNAPAFTRAIRAGDKVVRSSATKVKLGDNAPVFGR
jgi:ribosomal protein L27